MFSQNGTIISNLPATGVAPITDNVIVIIFNPTMPNGQSTVNYFGWNDPNGLRDDYKSWLYTTTHGNYQYNIVNTIVLNDFPTYLNGQKYTPQGYINCIRDQSKCFPASVVNTDYNKVLNNQNICQMVNKSQVNEVWLYGGPYMGLFESTLVGPAAKLFLYNDNGGTVSTICNKLVPIMGFSYERTLSEEIHDFGHRTEATMIKVYGGFNDNPVTNWDYFASSKASYSHVTNGTRTVFGCGTIHYPPNVSDPNDPYDYSNQQFVGSYCDAFYNYPNMNNFLNYSYVNSLTWSSTDVGFYQWWFSHIPNKPGCATDKKLNNWWTYMMDPNTVFSNCVPSPTSTPGPSVSPSPTLSPPPTQTPTITPTPDSGHHRDGMTWCSNHGGIALTVDHDINTWPECLAWCDTKMNSTTYPLCQYNADGPRNCWVNRAPIAGIKACQWQQGVPPYGAWYIGFEKGITSTPTPTSRPTATPTPTGHRIIVSPPHVTVHVVPI